MINEKCEKRPKATNFLIKNKLKQYIPLQTKNSEDGYLNKSPTYFNRFNFLRGHQSPYLRQIQYMHRARSPNNCFKEGEDLGKTMKNLKVKPNYFLNEFNDVKNSIEQDKKFVKRAVNTFTNKNQKEVGDKYYIIDNNHKVNINKPLNKNDGKILSYKQYNHQSYQGEKYSKKFYNSFIQNNDYNYDMKLENNENQSKPVAQKICNIIIKGESREKTKKFKSSKKKHKIPNFIKNNIDIEENISQNSAIPDKNINFNINPTKNKLSSSVNYNEDEDYDNEENEIEEIEENEESITIGSKRKLNEINRRQIRHPHGRKIYKRKIKIEREMNKNNEEYEDDEEMLRSTNREMEDKNNHYINKGIELVRDNQEEIEIEEDGDLEEELEEGDGQEKEMEDEQIDQIEQLEDDDSKENHIIENNNEKIIENENEEESTNRLNKGEIEELEEEEQQTQNVININNDINKKIDFIMQKEGEIKIEGKINEQENKTLTNIENNENSESIQRTDNEILKHKSNDTNLDIIKDDNIVFLGEKKFKILEINKETNVQYIKKENQPILDIQKVDDFKQLKINKTKIYKNEILNITKNKENNVDIINEKEGQKENQDNFEIQNVESFEQQRQRDKKTKENKNIELKINKIKDNNFMLKSNEETPELEIENVLFYQQSPSKPRFNKRNKLNKLKIDQNNEGKFEIIGEPTNIICYEIYHIIPNSYNKKIYKKSNYKKYQISTISTYNYNSIQVINDFISSPEELTFMIKGKPKDLTKKLRNIIKREIIYFYNSPIQNNVQLSIENNINNTITPTKDYNTIVNKSKPLTNKPRYIAYNSDKRKISSSSISNSNTNEKTNLFNLNINPKINKIEKNDEKNEDKNYERQKTYKTKNANLLKPDTIPIKHEHFSIRRKYTDSKYNKNVIINHIKYNNYNDNNNSENNKDNKNINTNNYNRFSIGSPSYNLQSPNITSKDNIITKDYNTNIGIKQKLNYMSPKKTDEEMNNFENKKGYKNNNDNDNNNLVIERNNVGISKYEQYNKGYLNKSEKNNAGKTKSYISNKNNYKKEITKTPIPKENKKFYKTEYFTKNNRNKSHTLTISSNNREPKDKSITNISSKKLNETNISKRQSERKEKKDNKDNKENKSYIFVNTAHHIKNNNKNAPNEKKEKSKYKSIIYVSSNLNDDKNEKKNENKELRNNRSYYTSSYNSKKTEYKQSKNKNKSYINLKGSSRNINNTKDKDIKFETNITNTNNNMANTSAFSFAKDKNIENEVTKSSTSIKNKILTNTNFFSNKNRNNRNYITIPKLPKIIDNNKNDDNIIDLNNDNNNDIGNIDDKKEDNIDDKEDNNYDCKIDENNNNIIDGIKDRKVVNIQKTKKILNEKDDINNNNEPLIDNNYDLIKNSKYINKDNEGDNNNIFDQHNVGKKSQISDFSKSYINSYIPDSSRPALSYFSKQFLNTGLNSDINKRPELSNITRAYLISQKPINENDEDK